MSRTENPNHAPLAPRVLSRRLVYYRMISSVGFVFGIDGSAIVNPTG